MEPSGLRQGREPLGGLRRGEQALQGRVVGAQAGQQARLDGAARRAGSDPFRR